MSLRSSILLQNKRLRKPVRMLSGVHVVTVSMMPGSCPHGKCVYCPGGVDQGTPQSYILESPVVTKALPLGYHPYLQVHSRLAGYRRLGHTPSKIELIIIGGTFFSYPQAYLEWFVTQCLQALNRYPNATSPEASSLSEAQALNETSQARCVGMTIETRPDRANQEDADLALNYGVTRVELGVQTVFNEILRKAGRAHTIDDTKKATQTLKDSGFKVCYHMMLGLPGMDTSRELQAFEQVFEDRSFMPDMIKIYPTLVLKGTALYNLWHSGRYQPYSDDEIVEVITEIKRRIPRWVRINRVQREIPSKEVVAGLSTVNLREDVERRLEQKGVVCRCIRCREIGHNALSRNREDPNRISLTLHRDEYEASGGTEIFLSYEDEPRRILAGFLRLRVPSSEAMRAEFRKPTAIVRELHIYGSAIPVGDHESYGIQHTGLGTSLLEEAEHIASNDYECEQAAVISGVGVRGYYRGRGYARPDHSPYMFKNLRPA